MKRRAFLGLGATSIGVGALYGTAALSSVSAGRGISVSAAGDKDGALLGIDSDGYPIEFTNNTDSLFMTVTLKSDEMEFDVDGDGEFESPAEFNLDPEGDSDSIEVELTGDDDDAVDISVDLKEGGQTGSIIGTIELDRPFNVPEVAALLQVEGTVTGTSGNGRYDFELTNNSDEEVTIDAFGIDWTDNEEADRVSGRNNNNNIFTESNNVLIDGEPIIVGGDIVEVTEVEEVVFEENDPKSFEFRRFRDSDRDGVEVEDVDLRIRGGEDGIETVIELRLNE